MNSRNLRTLAVSFIAVLALAVSLASADTYKVDPVHSMVVFRIKHLDVSYVYGRFNDTSGTINYDDNDASKSSFDLTVQADSIDTHNDAHDKHLKSDAFFDVKQYPTITFKSTSVKKTIATGLDKPIELLDVTGDLTIHGVTKSITVTLTLTGTAKGMQGETRIGFDGELDLKRSDYDVKGLMGPVGDDVHLFINLESIKQ